MQQNEASFISCNVVSFSITSDDEIALRGISRGRVRGLSASHAGLGEMPELFLTFFVGVNRFFRCTKIEGGNKMCFSRPRCS